MKTKLSDLVGNTVVKLEVCNDESGLRFTLVNGEYVYIFVDGDCCSYSWFADILGQCFINECISSAEEILMPESLYDVEDGRTRQEYDRAYGIRIETCLGICDIVYRNSSNGYYGGNIRTFQHPSTYTCEKHLEENPFTWREISLSDSEWFS